MTDREKVIKAIDICLGHGVCNDCPYGLSGKGHTTMDCRDYMLRDALALLKEQESIIDSLKSDLNETLDVVTNRKNVVRCKDCKHGRLYAQDLVDCELQELAKDADWFCADGESYGQEKTY